MNGNYLLTRPRCGHSFVMCRLLVHLLITFGLVASSLEAQVRATLVSAVASVEPGRPFEVALRIEHAAHWHTYWVNPGTGLATSLEWTLPPGWTAGEIQWPVPRVFTGPSGMVTGHGYEGDLLLPVTLTPPATLKAGDTITLRAKAEWLMCSDTCVPASAPVELMLSVATGLAQPDAEWSEKIATVTLPVLHQNWKIEATRDGNEVRLFVHATSGEKPPAVGLHFFSQDSLIQYEQPQTLRVTPDGIEMGLSLSPDTGSETPRLRGVLATADSRLGWTIDVPLTEKPIAPVTLPAKAGGFAGTLLLALAGGLILNLMPCVFPVLGIKILGFVNQSGNDRKKITLHGLVFTIGVMVSFWSLAGVLLILRAGGSQLGWGFQLQSPAFVFGMAVFLLIFALNMSGLCEVGLAATGTGARLQMKQGYSGSFFTGALATLVATPCSAPFLAPALGAALALPAFQSFLVFTAIGVGLSTPYLFLSLFPQAIKLLPRPGAWMETFKQLMAFPLYATVGWLLWVLAGQTKDDDNALLLVTFGFVFVAMGVWVYGRYAQAHGKIGRQRFGYMTSAALLAVGLGVGWPKSAPASAAGGYQIVWEKWSPEAVAAAQASGHLVYVDFTARWCATCQTNKAVVFHSDAVLAALSKKNVVLLRGDWTSKDPKITAELARWNRSAVPFNLVYSPARAAPRILPELLTANVVLSELN